MTKGNKRPHLFRLIPLLTATVAAAVLFSGCLWGVVVDAETGDPLPGVTVNYVDMNGMSGSAVTNADGMYIIDQADGPVPAMGPISFQIYEPGFEPQTAARLLEYNDNPNATTADLSTFWEVQSFDLVPELVQRVDVRLLNVDVDHVAGMPSGAGPPYIWFYVVDLKVTPILPTSPHLSVTKARARNLPRRATRLRCPLTMIAWSWATTCAPS
jgi:hypothetical protein